MGSSPETYNDPNSILVMCHYPDLGSKSNNISCSLKFPS